MVPASSPTTLDPRPSLLLDMLPNRWLITRARPAPVDMAVVSRPAMPSGLSRLGQARTSTTDSPAIRARTPEARLLSPSFERGCAVYLLLDPTPLRFCVFCCVFASLLGRNGREMHTSQNVFLHSQGGDLGIERKFGDFIDGF
jgi:hypothetical protein